MTKQQRDMVRIWLARACGVGSTQVTDEQVEAWERLRMEICGYVATEESARATRATGRRLQVHVERERGVEVKNGQHPDAVKMFGPRPKLRSES